MKDLSPSARFINTSPTYRVKAVAPCNPRSITDDLRWDNYFGRAVNLAARITSQAAAKQIFAGEDLVPGGRAGRVRPRKLGGFELKGIVWPVMLCEVVRDGPG